MMEMMSWIAVRNLASLYLCWVVLEKHRWKLAFGGEYVVRDRRGFILSVNTEMRECIWEEVHPVCHHDGRGRDCRLSKAFDYR